MIDIDLLDQGLDRALTDELRHRVKPIVRPTAHPVASTRAPDAEARPRVQYVTRSGLDTVEEPDPWLLDDDFGPEDAPRQPAPPRVKVATPAPKPPSLPRQTTAVRPAPPPPPPPPPRVAAPARAHLAEEARPGSEPAEPPRLRVRTPARPLSERLEPPPSTWTDPLLNPPSFEADLEAPAPAKPRRAPLAARLRPDTPPPAQNRSTPPAHRARPKPRQAEVRLEAPDGGWSTDQIVELLVRGQIEVVDRLLDAHAAFAANEGNLDDRRVAAGWATLRAILRGDQAAARESSAMVLALGSQAGDPDALDRYWSQHAWIVLEWGNAKQRDQLLDHCRQRAYWKDDMRWRSMLALVLARFGRIDEAQREFDTTADRCLQGSARDAAGLDITTNLAEAAAYLGDARRASQIHRAVAWPTSGLVVGHQADVCKGSVARYRALLAATTSRWVEADADFRTAVEAHRRVGAEALLARTLQESGRSLTGRDDARARGYLEESAELARQLKLVERFPAS